MQDEPSKKVKNCFKKISATSCTLTPTDSVIEARTDGAYGSYDEMWLSVQGKTSVQFSVRLCTDAHVALATIPMETGMSTTEVVIGGWENKKSAIRKTVDVSFYGTYVFFLQQMHNSVAT